MTAIKTTHVGSLPRPQEMVTKVLRKQEVTQADLRRYLQAFASAVYQNPRSICPQHQMITPRAITE